MFFILKNSLKRAEIALAKKKPSSLKNACNIYIF